MAGLATLTKFKHSNSINFKTFPLICQAIGSDLKDTRQNESRKNFGYSRHVEKCDRSLYAYMHKTVVWVDGGYGCSISVEQPRIIACKLLPPQIHCFVVKIKND